MTSQNEFVAQLEMLLDDEKQALLKAEFGGFSRVLDEKARLISMLDHIPENSSILQTLRAKIMQNQALLDETMAAIRSTAQRIADLQYSRRSVSTYNHMGQRRFLQPDPNVSVEKKA